MSVTRLNVINSDNSTLQLNNISNENIRLGQGGGITDIGASTPLNVNAAGIVTINNLTDSSSISSGALIIKGGLGIEKKLFTGTDVSLATVSGTTSIGSVTPLTVSSSGVLRVDNETDSTSITSGAAIIDGGMGISKNLFVGTDILVSGRIGIGTNSPESALHVVGVRANIPTTKGVHLGEGGAVNDYAIDICAGTASSASYIDFTLINQDFRGRIIYTHNNDLMAFHTNNSLSPSFSISSSGAVNIPGLTASQAVFTDSSDNLISVAVNGTGNVVLTTSPTLITPNIGVASGTSLNLSGALTVSGISTMGTSNSVTVSATGFVTIPTSLAISSLTASKPVSTNGSNVLITSPVTGTGSTVVLDTSPTLITPNIGVASGTSLNLSGALTVSGISTMGATTPVTVSAAGVLRVDNVTDSSNLTTGSIVTLGGQAITKKLYTGTDTFLATVSGITSVGSSSALTISASGALNVINSTDATDSTIGGSVTVSGGLAVAKKLYTGTDTFLANISGVTTIGSVTGATVSASGVLTINNITDSTGLSSGSLVNLGGLSVTKKLYTGDATFLSVSSGTTTIGSVTALTITADGVLNVNNISSSISSSSGSVVLQGGLSITNVTDATSTTVGGTITTGGGAAIAKKLFVGGNVSFLNGLNMNNTFITNVADPINDGDATNKAYVDSVAQGLDIKESVIASTVGPGTLATSFENGDILDDITLVTGNRILVKDQVNAVENGIYIVQATGTPLRSADFATATSQSGSFVFVEFGTANGSTGWVVTNNSPDDIVDTDPLVFTQFSGAGQIIAGTGLTKTVNTLSVNASLTHVTAVGTLSSLTVSPGIISGVDLNLSSLVASKPVFTDGSKNLITVDTTGTGTNVVLQTSPTLITPVLGVASGTSLSLTSTTDATSAVSGGSFTTVGGLAVAKQLFVGTNVHLSSLSGTVTMGSLTPLTVSAAGVLRIDNETDSSSSTTGSLIVDGGAGIAKKLYTGTDTFLATVSGSVTIGSTTQMTISASGVANITNTTASTSTTTGSLIVSGGVGITGALYADSANFVSLSAPHSGLTGLTVGDDHTQYTLLAGRATGQIITGGTTSGDDLVLRSTTDVTKGNVIIDEVTDSTGVTSGALVVNGGMGIAKKLFVGTSQFIGGDDILGISRLALHGASGNAFTGPNFHAIVDDEAFPVLQNLNFAHDNVSFNFDMFFDGFFFRKSHSSNGFQIYKRTNQLEFLYTSPDIAGEIAVMNQAIVIGSTGTVSIGTTNAITISAAGSVTVPVLTASKPVSTNASNVLITSPVTGTGSTVVLDTSPTLVTPNIGVASGTSLNLSGALTVSGISTLGATNSVTISAAGAVTIPTTLAISSLTASKPVSTNGSNVLITSPVTGTGSTVVLDTNPILVTPNIGVASGTSLNLSGALTVSGISTMGATTPVTISAAGAVTIPTTLAISSLTASKPVSTNGSNVLITSPVTGTGSTVVLDTSPTLITPNIGVASGTSLNLSGALTVSGISTLGATTPVTISALGVLRVDNETDATSSTAGAAIVDGGLAVAKKAFIGTDLLVSGRIGVGTTSPESALQVVGVRANIPTTKGVHIGEGGLPNDYAIDICAGTATSSSFIDFSRINQDFGGRIIYTHTNGLMSFHTNSSPSASFSISSSGVINIPNLSASQAVFTDGSDNLVSVAVNGTGNVVLTTSPTLITPNIGVASGTSLNLSGALTVSGISTLGATNSVTISAAGILRVTNTTNATSATSAALVVDGGLGVSGSVFIGTKNITPNTGDITLQTTFTGAQSASAANVTGLSFNPANTRSFEVLMSVVILATSNLYAQFKLQGIYNGVTWYFSPTYLGDNTLVTFAITNGGQVTYSSSSYTGFSSLTMNFKATTLNI